MEHRRARTVSFALVLSLFVPSALALAGCESAPGLKSKTNTPNDVAKGTGGATGETTTTSAALAGAQTPAIFTPGLSVSDMIAQACGIKATAGRSVTPSFEYDSAALGEADRAMLAEVAKCLTEGALKGKTLSLVGRADARGEAEYNMTLGESRATAVQRYLTDLGAGKDRSKATSRGEMDAVGTNEEGWAKDRRVDIELAL